MDMVASPRFCICTAIFLAKFNESFFPVRALCETMLPYCGLNPLTVLSSYLGSSDNYLGYLISNIFESETRY